MSKTIFMMVLFSMVVMSITSCKQSSVPRIFGLFGFTRDLPPFKGKTEQEIAEQLAEMGVNAVWGGEDDKVLVEALHAKGIKVYATVGMFGGWNEHNRPITEEGKPLELYVEDHWYQGACPNHEQDIRENLKTIRRLAETSYADGIWLDGIRWPIYWETPKPMLLNTCFSEDCIIDFENTTGITVPTDKKTPKEKAEWLLTHYDKEWAKWKMGIITDIVRRCAETLKQVKPNAILGAFTVPWRRSDYDNAIERIVAQDYPNMARYMDVFSPMVYHRMCAQGANTAWIHEITAYVKKDTGKAVWPIIQAHSEPECVWNPYQMTKKEFASALAEGLKSPSDGVIVFTAEAMIQGGYTDIVEKAFTGRLRR